MNAKEILDELKKLGSPGYKATMLRHGAVEPIYGVKIEDMKKILKRTKTNYQLALDLYDTGITDAMYLAGLMADDAKMTKKDIINWLEKAKSPWIAEYTVPWVAAGSPFGHELAIEWIESKNAATAAAGWATLGGLVASKPDSELDLDGLKQLLLRVQKTIHQAPGRVRYVMNSFVIAVGSSVKPLSSLALQVAEKIGEVSVDMGNTDCKVPYAPDYIKKIEQRGSLGKKRKHLKC
ncbi:MAG: DNA alkylation repair protein [Planctomycetota bacterium]